MFAGLMSKFGSVASGTSGFRALNGVGLRAFQNFKYGAAAVAHHDIERELSANGWRKTHGYARTRHIRKAVSAKALSRVLCDNKGRAHFMPDGSESGPVFAFDLAAFQRRVDLYFEGILKTMTDSECDTDVFVLNDGSIVLVETGHKFSSGFSIAAFLTAQHRMEAESFMDEPLFSEEIRRMQTTAKPTFGDKTRICISPVEHESKPIAMEYVKRPHASLTVGEGAYRTGKDTKWRLTTYTDALVEFLTKQKMTTYPIDYSLSQRQTC